MDTRGRQKDLLAEYKKAGFRWESLLESEAYHAEKHLAGWLQKRNIGAYFK